MMYTINVDIERGNGQDSESSTSGFNEDKSPNSPNGGTSSANRVTEVLASLETNYVIPSQSKTSISRVPRALGEANREAYTPQVVSIGPYHHSNDRLLPMKKYKYRYLADFFLRGPENGYQVAIENLIELEDRARACYEGTVLSDKNEFVEMMLLDGCFILELLFKYWNPEKELGTRDQLFRKHSMLPSLRFDMPSLRFDMLLLENQLPFFVIEKLFVLFTGPSEKFMGTSFIQLILHFFSFPSYVKIARETPREKPKGGKPKHFLDLLRDCCLPSTNGAWSEMDREMVDGMNKVIPRATELHEAGVKFTRVTGNCFEDLKFSTKGVFKIPPLIFDSYTEVVFRNLVAFEQCFQHSTRHYITLYLYLMDSLINSPSDVAILRRYGVIDALSDDEHVSYIFNNICKGIVINTNIHFYHEISQGVNQYCKTPWNSFKALLFREYFYSPWSIASSAAVIIVVLCTIIQAVCSVISVIP